MYPLRKLYSYRFKFLGNSFSHTGRNHYMTNYKRDGIEIEDHPIPCDPPGRNYIRPPSFFCQNGFLREGGGVVLKPPSERIFPPPSCIHPLPLEGYVGVGCVCVRLCVCECVKKLALFCPPFFILRNCLENSNPISPCCNPNSIEFENDCAV